ncbi:MAG: RNA polymerase sigma factor [Planctomycetota bacterium]
MTEPTEAEGRPTGMNATVCTDDGTLLARAFRHGDEQAYADLVTLYRDRLYRLAYRLTGRQEDALDVVQDAFLKVYKDINAWTERASFYSWVYRVTSNLAIDRLRRRKRDRSAKAKIQERTRSFVPDPTDAIAELSERRHRLGMVKAAIDTLPEGQREIMVLRHFEGLSLREIATLRGCALGTVKSTLFQALKSLKRQLPDQGSPRSSEPTQGRRAS